MNKNLHGTAKFLHEVCNKHGGIMNYKLKTALTFVAVGIFIADIRDCIEMHKTISEYKE